MRDSRGTGGDSLLMSSRGDEFVARLAESKALTIVVGAGSSIESGLPGWDALVRDLLHRVATDRGLEGQEVEEFAEWTIARDGLPAAGAIAQAALGERFLPVLQTALYGKTSVLAPGPTADAIARLRVQWEATDSEVVTTNYDELLEEALRAEVRGAGLEGVRVRSATAADSQAIGEFLIRHVHGLLRLDGSTDGTVVLSEGDYYRMQDEAAWQEQYFSHQLGETVCVFVGTSLTDPNLLRYLYRSQAPTSSPHVVLVARQQDADLYEGARKSVATTREEAAASRWDRVGVRPAHLDHYGQTALFLDEVWRKRVHGSRYVPYRHRLARWQQELNEVRLSTSDGTFRGRQDEFQSILSDVVKALRERLADVRIATTSSERLACSLWVYQADKDALVNWAYSDRSWRDPNTLEPVKVEWASPFAAVKAFCSGSVTSYSTTEQAATRWNHVLGIPLFLDADGEYGRLPVGVATLASTLPEEQSCLGRGFQAIQTDIGREVAATLAALLDPD